MLSRTDTQRDNLRGSTTKVGPDDDGVNTGRGSTTRDRDKKIVVRMRSSQMELNAYELNQKKEDKQRMCGCDSYCAIF